ncbi:MAG: acyltransferase [Flavobacteriales bacterium]|nr:acyltransferase [Flavobacteriales bacterium]MBK6944310.1 acyltransferase [Flavobacteriales bacterium]MBK7295193.1 acyltransferase [Flavobacteriales bacterium]MBK9533978.1 acyltransferase [Flavobacteriales bacterium]HQV53472.1 acyltransferase [Flavobacteriales bacterium]
MSASTSPKSTRFVALDGVRAVCAYVVVLHHFGPDIPMLQHPFILAFIGQLNLCLTPFFVLSGFVITYHYFDLPSGGFKPYIMRRVGRIVPLYLVLSTVTFAVRIQQGMHVDGKEFFFYLIDIALLKGWFDELKFSGIMQGWSLTTEMAFYLLAPFIFLVIHRRGWRAVIVLPLLFVGLGLLLVNVVGGNALYGFMDSNMFMFGATVLGRAPDFFVGIGLAIAYKKLGSTIQNHYATLIGSIIITICLFVRAYFHWDYNAVGGIMISNFVLPVFGVSLLFWGFLTEETLLRKLLSTKLFQVVGRSSYAFYLIHFGVFYTAFHSVLGHLPATIFTLQILAVVLYRRVEAPCARWVKRRWPFPVSLAAGNS